MIRFVQNFTVKYYIYMEDIGIKIGNKLKWNGDMNSFPEFYVVLLDDIFISHIK
jgi:hypothetical protein